MDNEKSIDKLARTALIIGGLAVGGVLCWYFRSILAYIAAAFVVSLVGQPIMGLLRRIRIKGKSAPDALLAALTIILIAAGAVLVITRVIPFVSGIIRDASILNNSGAISDRSILDKINVWIISVCPWVGEDFDGVRLIIEKLSNLTNLSAVPGLIGSVASAVAGITVGTFSVIFISFFFIKDEGLFGRIVGALVPDKIEERVGRTVLDIERLLSRYFVGLLIEIFGVALLDCLGLWLITGIGFNYAIGIAIIAGLLNVIPYVGPLIGEIIGVVLCVILKYGTGAGLDVNIWLFALIVLGVMLAVQLVDNFVYQPLIYSTSIKANALEIFIVLLVAGRIGGITGLFIAIPSYTVIRVIASRFFYSFKPIRRLIPDVENENTDALV